MDYQLPLSDMTVHIQVSLIPQINGLEQCYSNSSALAMELLQYCTKPSKYGLQFDIMESALCLQHSNLWQLTVLEANSFPSNVHAHSPQMKHAYIIGSVFIM